MKKIEDRNQAALYADIAGHIQSRKPNEPWGDNLPIVRLGSEIGFANMYGHVFPSIEEAFVFNSNGCKCLATSSVEEAINKIAQFLVLVAMAAKPSEIAKLMFHGEIFVFETFSDMMEGRGLVEHEGDMVEGYQPLVLAEEGEAGLRMCFESDMVDLPFDRNVAYQAAFPELVAIELAPDNETNVKPPVRAPQEQIDRMTNWALRLGVLKMNRDGTITESRKYRTYSPDELRRSRGRTADMRRIAKSKR